MGAVDVRRAGDRFVSQADGRVARYSFSYAEYYDAGNTHHGLLLAHNEETLEPGAGYDEHPHRHVEIVTWVLEGTLTHGDSGGVRRDVAAGHVQLMSAGSGVQHSERNEGTDPVRYVQMWIVPDGRSAEPGYQQVGPLPDPIAQRLTPPGQPDATFAVALPDAEGVTLPAASYRHLFVATGRVEVPGVGRLGSGDAVRFAGTGELRVTGSADSRIGVWAMGSTLGG